MRDWVDELMIMGYCDDEETRKSHIHGPGATYRPCGKGKSTFCPRWGLEPFRAA